MAVEQSEVKYWKPKSTQNPNWQHTMLVGKERKQMPWIQGMLTSVEEVPFLQILVRTIFSWDGQQIDLSEHWLKMQETVNSVKDYPYLIDAMTTESDITPLPEIKEIEAKKQREEQSEKDEDMSAAPAAASKNR
eukprot:9046404-Karenia_brevis.AAC.1